MSHTPRALFLAASLLLAAPAWALPDAAGIAGIQSGYADNTEIKFSLDFQTADYGRAVDVFVLLQMGNTYLARDGDGKYQTWTGGVPPSKKITPNSARVTESLGGGLNLFDFPAVSIHVGYGYGMDEMLASQRYKTIYPQDTGDALLPALPRPATPAARRDAEALLAALGARLAQYNPADPAIQDNSDFLRTAALFDQVALAIGQQHQQEDRILQRAAETGNFDLASGEAITIPVDPAGATPDFCSGSVVCRRSYDSASGETLLTLMHNANGTDTAGTAAAPVSLPVSGVDLPGQALSLYPASIRATQCMPWSTSCTSVNALSSTSLGAGYESLAAAVTSQASAMLATCASYIEGVYRAQATPTYGSADRAAVYGSYLPAAKKYYLYCHEEAMFWTYTHGTLYEATVDSTGHIATQSPNWVANKIQTFRDTKDQGIAKLVANVVVGQIPYVNVVNSGVKCLFGTSLVDMVMNRSRTINGLACRQAALNLATSVLPILKTIPIPIANSGSLTSAAGITLAALDGIDDFWSRLSYAMTTSNSRYGLPH